VLVILLAIIVIASSTGIYLLLRHGEPSPTDRTARRRKYSIRRRGVRTHPLPIGLPGSLSDKLGSMFKSSSRARSGWVPARDNDDGDDDDVEVDNYRVGANVWDSTDEAPPRDRDLDRDEYPRVGSTPVSRLTVLSDDTTGSAHRSREATHVDAAGAESSARLLELGPTATSVPPAPVVQAPAQASVLAPSWVQKEVPDEAWLNADDARSSVGGGGADGSHAASPLGYHAPQPRRADSGYEIPLFAGSTPFRQDTDV
jgi:hypothetical protein